MGYLTSNISVKKVKSGLRFCISTSDYRNFVLQDKNRISYINLVISYLSGDFFILQFMKNISFLKENSAL